jgi:CRISPR type IV-associated protein Csf2
LRTYEYQGTMTALSSISHNGGQSFGVNSKLRREKFVQPDGSVEEIPVLSGNGLRGMLRDRGMLHMCRALGYGVESEAGGVDGLSLGAFHFLFSGGSLSGGGKSIDEDEARRLRALIPLASVFGGAVAGSGRILNGKAKIGKAIPVCRESLHLLPARFHSDSARSIWDYTQEEMYTRKDDEKSEKLRPVIAPAVRALLDHARAEKEARPPNQAQEDTGTHQQMRYFVETLAAGTPLYWRIVLEDVTDLEWEAFMMAMVEFSRLPYVGGKSAVGLGEVALKFDRWIEIDSRVVESKEIAAPAGALYLKHLSDKAKDIREFLRAM